MAIDRLLDVNQSRGGAMFDAEALLDRAPDPIRRLAHRVAEGRGMLGRVADVARYRFSTSDIPALPPVGNASVRLVIGPTNSAGQGYQWARAVERSLPDVSAVALQRVVGDPFQPDVDIRVPVAVYQRSSAWHAAFGAFLAEQTHVIWESGLPLLGRRYRSDPARELEVLAAAGVRGALMFHGSDIRPPSLHAEGDRWSPFRRASGITRALEDTTSRNATLVEQAGLPVFVSTPDLLRWLPAATWCPVVVDVSKWRAGEGERSARVPVVAHAPSQKWLKGTDYIEPTLRRLSAEGVIEYRQVIGVPHASMPSFYADADIVLDQFLLGGYGVASCEAMASGKVVMGHVDDFTRAQVRERTGLDLPIHEVTIESLEAELRRAAAEPDVFGSLRAAGPRFVEHVHDGRRSATALAPFIGVSG